MIPSLPLGIGAGLALVVSLITVWLFGRKAGATKIIAENATARTEALQTANQIAVDGAKAEGARASEQKHIEAGIIERINSIPMPMLDKTEASLVSEAEDAWKRAQEKP